MKKIGKYILFLFLLVPLSGMCQFAFNRTIEKRPSSDTIILRYQIRQYKAGEICRIQQKIPTSFKIISQEQKADTSYFNKDIATSIWSSMPNDSLIEYSIKLKAPEKSQGYIYVGDCACMYGGKSLAPTRKYFPKERVYLTDSTLVPYQDTVLFSQIDSINKIPATKKQISNKNHRKAAVKKDVYVFRIQITATKIKQDMKDMRRNVIPPDLLFEEFENDFYKYTIGNFKTYNQAKERLQIYQQHKTNGYIVAYKNGVRVGVKEAKADEEPELIEQ